MINHAIKYAEKGIYVIPVWWIEKGKCACGNDKCPEKNWGKHPIPHTGLKEATNSKMDVKKWWTKYPTANIGIVCNKSGYSVLDIDPRHGGNDSFSNLIKAYSDLPLCPRVKTGGDGEHYYLKHNKDFRLPEGFNASGIDIRNNAYVIAPPSIHKSGKAYEWYDDQSVFDLSAPNPPDYLINPIKDVTQSSHGDGTAIDDLKTISGKQEVRCEKYSFRKNTNKTLQILVNGEPIGAWIDTKGYIGSHSRGGPTIIQWIQWFGYSKEESIAIANKYCGDLVKKEITLKIAYQYINKFDDTFWQNALNKFYIYEKGVYKQKTDEEFQLLLINRLPYMQTLSISKRNHVIQNMKMLLIKKLDEINVGDILNFENGLFDINNKQFISHSKEHYHTIRLPYKFNPEAKCPLWIKTLKEIFRNDQNKIRTMQEFFGYCLTKETKYEKALILIGDGSTGKSTVFGVMQDIVGEENYSALPLKHFGNPVLISAIMNQLVNISGEMNKRAEDFEAEFRTVVSGEHILVNEKFIPAYKEKPFCKLIFSANELPYIDDKSSGFSRRLLAIEFDRQFKEDELDIDLKHKLKEEKSGILNWAVEGLYRLRERKKFIIDEYMNKIIKDIKKANNPIEEFVECMIEPIPKGESGVGIYKGTVYSRYVEWCKENGYKSCGANKFSTNFYNINKDKTEKDRHDNSGRYWPGLKIVNDKFLVPPHGDSKEKEWEE